ncbi:NAD(P)H-quinone oxidoreductase subunit F, partial [Microbacteriaceae bacterium K1510]|nr:NAD(P)H-quinone oxidoreductase subunit F [Microbacteriaceae bacterium K1510]
YVGGFTAIFAASIGLTQRDIKRVLAYSTVSQLGYMMLALGVAGAAGYVGGTFHLMTHAFFKALLFLAAGSVIHAVHTQDVFEMGGLWKKMPVTGMVFLIGCLAIAGVPPFAGFWSKEEILGAVYSAHRYD